MIKQPQNFAWGNRSSSRSSNSNVHEHEYSILQEATYDTYKMKQSIYGEFLYDRWFHWFILWKQTKISQIRKKKKQKHQNKRNLWDQGESNIGEVLQKQQLCIHGLIHNFTGK